MNLARVLLPVALVACATTASVPTTRSGEAVPFRLPAEVHPKAYRLALEVAPAQPRFSGSVEIDLELALPRTVIYLHARHLHVQRSVVRVAGVEHPATFASLNEDGMASLTLADAIGPGPVTVRVEYDAPFGDHNDGLYRVAVEGASYAFTQFEATTARLAFPSFDEPGFKAPLALELTVPQGELAAGNMPIESREAVRPGFERVRFLPTPPLPTYLYAWVVGPFDVVEAPPLPPNEVRSAPLPLRGIATRGHGPELADSLHFAAPTIAALESYFGTAFPFPKIDLVAVPDFGAGAMENAGLITFRDALLLYREATAPVQIRKDQEIVLAHELAHQWFGDLVTLAWWDDTWLNESFAEWLNYPIAQLVRPEFHYPLEQAEETSEAMILDGLVSARQVHQPVETPGDIQNAFDGITYSKGQGVIRMFERYLGPEKFRAGVRAYVEAHANRTATAADLLRALGEQVSQDVATPFRTFIDQAGVPLVDVQLDCAGKKPRLLLRQQRFLPTGSRGDRHRLWQVPFCASFPAQGGVAQACTLLTAEQGSLDLPVATCPAWVHPNPDQGGYYRWSLPGPQLAALATAPLSDLDRLTVSLNLEAAESAGAVTYADALATLAPLISNPEPAIGAPAANLLLSAEANFADDAWRPRVHAVVAALYRPVLARTGFLPQGPTEDARVATRRILAARVLARVAEDAPTRHQLAELGRAYLPDLAGPAHPEAIDPGVAGLAVAESVRADPSRLDGLIARLATEQDATVREVLLYALETQETEPAASRVRDLSLDPKVRTNEVFPLLASQLQNRHTREAAWTWLTGHWAPFTQRLDDDTRAALPLLAESFCTEADGQRVEALITPHLAELPGAERSLKQTLEGIHLCAAHAAAQRASAQAYFLAH